LEIAEWMESRAKGVLHTANREQLRRCQDLFRILDLNGNELVEEVG
jgi:hypothetical protein